jgi:hypothetical protein
MSIKGRVIEEDYTPGELILAFPYARPPEMHRVGVLIEMTCERPGDSGGNEWRVLCSDGEIWSLAEFQFRKLSL